MRCATLITATSLKTSRVSPLIALVPAAANQSLGFIEMNRRYRDPGLSPGTMR
jgi:hypothetical protein